MQVEYFFASFDFYSFAPFSLASPPWFLLSFRLHSCLHFTALFAHRRFGIYQFWMECPIPSSPRLNILRLSVVWHQYSNECQNIKAIISLLENRLSRFDDISLLAPFYLLYHLLIRFAVFFCSIQSRIEFIHVQRPSRKKSQYKGDVLVFSTSVVAIDANNGKLDFNNTDLEWPNRTTYNIAFLQTATI